MPDSKLPDRLRKLRLERGVSYRTLGSLINYSYAYICQIEHGIRPAPIDVIARIDAALKAGGELITLASSQILDIDERDRLDHVASQPRHVDTAALDSLAVVLARHRHLEDTIGVGMIWQPARSQLALVEKLLSESRGRILNAVMDLAAQHTQYIGWLTLATGRRGSGALFTKAERLSEQSGNRDMQATAISFRGYAARLSGRPTQTIAASRAALALRGVYIGQMAYDVGQMARAYAMYGDVRKVRCLLAQHQDLADATAAYSGPVAPWHYFRTPAFFRLERGLTLALLANHTGERAHANAAIFDLAGGVAMLPAGQDRAEWLADPFLLTLADAQLRIGDRAAAIETVSAIRRIATVTGSAALARRAGAVLASPRG